MSSSQNRAGGLFITLEGGEGTGKSTQIRRLAARLAKLGYDTVVTREPGGSPKAEKLREIILSGFVESYGPIAETLAFAAARIDHLDKTIRPALSEGCVVICDRFMDSTRAYQGALGDIDPQLIDRLEQIAVGDTRPDLTLILDLPPETGLKRANARRGHDNADRFEGEDIAFHNAVRQAFLAIAADEPQRCARIFAGKSEDEVEEDIWRIVQERLLDDQPAPADSSKPATADSPGAEQKTAPVRMPRAPRLQVVGDDDTNSSPEKAQKPDAGDQGRRDRA